MLCALSGVRSWARADRDGLGIFRYYRTSSMFSPIHACLSLSRPWLAAVMLLPFDGRRTDLPWLIVRGEEKCHERRSYGEKIGAKAMNETRYPTPTVLMGVARSSIVIIRFVISAI